MPKRLIDSWASRRLKTVEAKTAVGLTSFGIYEAGQTDDPGSRLRGRVAEVADDCPVLIGYIPLELLDFVVDPKNQRLIGNPDHGGEFMIDMY